jgi:hypothetical protein
MSKEAEKNKPIKPPGAYFAFRSERLKSMPTSTTNRSSKIYCEWIDLPQEEKAKYEKEFLEKMKEHAIKLKEWQKEYGHLAKPKTERSKEAKSHAKMKQGAGDNQDHKNENGDQ